MKRITIIEYETDGKIDEALWTLLQVSAVKRSKTLVSTHPDYGLADILLTDKKEGKDENTSKS